MELLLWVLFNCITTSVGHLMQKRLASSVLICIGVFNISKILVKWLIWSDFGKYFFLEIARTPLVGSSFEKGLLNSLSCCIFGEFAWNCHNLTECAWLWGVFYTLNILGWSSVLISVTWWYRYDQSKGWKLFTLPSETCR